MYKVRNTLTHTRAMSKLAQLPKLSSFTQALPPDLAISTTEKALANEKNVVRTPRILQLGAFSWSLPEQRKAYKYVTSSTHALQDLGLDASEPENPQFQAIVSGQTYLDPAFVENGLPVPYSQAYAGWQFGQFAGQLGDGRVHDLFEIPKPEALVLPSSRLNRRKYEVQLKGSGKTPFSRFADGKAVVRSSIREYIISEHLNSIGIPTTRALSLTYLPKTYAQRHAAEKCAIVARFAELWVRLGTFDLYRWRSDIFGVRSLSDYVIDELFTLKSDGQTVQFPFLAELLATKSDFFNDSQLSLGRLTQYDNMYLEIIVRNAITTAKWQCYGFLNGVLNTDNTSVLGLSMDFGPFSIMDRYDPTYTPNSEDHQGRYSYANTPTAIWWNLTRLGENLAQLIGAGTDLIDSSSFKRGTLTSDEEEKIVKRAIKLIEVGGEMYKYAFTKEYVETFFNRLGLSHKLIDVQDPDKQNAELIAPLLDVLKKVQCDFNKFFLSLQDADVSLPQFDEEAFAKSILLKEVSEHEIYNRDEITADIVAWIKKFKIYVDKGEQNKSVSSRYNPKFLPRNWILDEAIQFTQESDFEDLSYLHKLEKMAFNPYDSSKWGSELKDVEARWLLQSDIGEEKSMLQCSCSS